MALSVVDVILAEVPSDADFLVVAWRTGGVDVEFRFTGASQMATARTLRTIAENLVDEVRGAPAGVRIQ